MKIVIIQNVSINDHRMVHIDGIARELLKRGYEVDIIIQKSNEEPQFSDLPYNVTYIQGDTYSIIGQLKFSYMLFKLLRKQEYDIIHTKNPFSSILPALLNKSKAKVIYDIRGLWIDFGVHAGTISKKTAYFINKIDMLCMKKADKVIAISNELKKMLVKRGLNKDKIDVIIGDGFDLEKVKGLNINDIRNFLSIEGKIIGYVGSISRSRYSEKIIKAFEIVHRKMDSSKLVMMGPCREVGYFQNLIEKSNLVNHIYFTGFINSHDEVLKLIKSFDVAISYHDEELPCFNVMVPTKVLEYLATGSNIVATNHKSHKSILTHGKDSYLTDQNVKSFAKGIIHVLENNELSKNISKNALITAEKYSFEKVTNKIEKVYEGLREFTDE